MAEEQGRSLSHNAWALALINMASNDALIVSFATKYFYQLWRPETAIRRGNEDDNKKTEFDVTFVPYILTPCFPSYPSNHASGSTGAAEALRRIYGAGGHESRSPTWPCPGWPSVTSFKQITNDIDDARVYGGIHFRFDQDAGSKMGREVATYVVKHNLLPIHPNHD